MIATVTLNPAVDYTVSLTQPLQKDTVNRTATEQLTPGGKGINVSVILHRLGADTTAHGLLAGMTGQMIAHAVSDLHIPAQWLVLPEGSNRINMKLTDDDGTTEINGSGIALQETVLQTLIAQLQAYGKDDIIVLAGSIPKGARASLYGDIMEQLRHTGAQFAVDAEGNALREALSRQPLIIKPNLSELCDLFAVTFIASDADLLHYAKQLQSMGARNVLISLGGEGAFLLTEHGQHYRMAAPQGKPRSTVGAGDSMLAGWLAGYAKGCSAEECLRMGIACGSATAFSPWLAEKETIRFYYARTQI
ncbi:MAG: 1-phosphofructokinase [Oscillospiraceae bacterium]